MSESKSYLRSALAQAHDELSIAENNCIYLLDALFRLKDEHPDIELPHLGDYRFNERIWRQVQVS